VNELFANELLWQWVGNLIGVGLAAVAVAFALKYAAKYAKEAAYMIRHYTPQAIEAVDQPSDAVIKFLTGNTPIPSTVWVTVLPAVLKALAEGLEALDTRTEAEKLHNRIKEAAEGTFIPNVEELVGQLHQASIRRAPDSPLEGTK